MNTKAGMIVTAIHLLHRKRKMNKQNIRHLIIMNNQMKHTKQKLTKKFRKRTNLNLMKDFHMPRCMRSALMKTKLLFKIEQNGAENKQDNFGNKKIKQEEIQDYHTKIKMEELFRLKLSKIVATVNV